MEAELVTANEGYVVLERKADGELLAIRRNELSEKDQNYISANEKNGNDESSAKEGQTKATTDKSPQHDSIWNLSDGEVVKGRLIGFGTQELVIGRERGRIMVNDRSLDELPPAYEKIVPDVVSHVDNQKITSRETLEAHLADLGGGPFTYRVEGIQLDLATFGTLTIPVSLLTASDAEQVKPGLERWRVSQDDGVSVSDRSATSSRERMVLDSQERYRRNAQQRERQLQMMELNLLAIESGITDAWEVAIYPNQRYGNPRTVVVNARDSLQAQQQVVRRYPGWRIGAIVKASY